MAFLKTVALLIVSTTVVFGMPTYIAIPLSDLEAMGLVAEPLYERPIAQARMMNFEPEPSESNLEEEYIQAPSVLIATEDRPKRQSGGYGHDKGGDNVDYGAYTGGYGSFGWYTDHPVFSKHPY